MPGTFSQIYIQIVFAVKGRENMIGNSWKTELHKYIAGTIKGKGQIILLTITNLLRENLHGRKVTVHFNILIHIWEKCMIIYLIRKGTIKSKHSRKSTLDFWKNLGWNMMKNICLSGTISL